MSLPPIARPAEMASPAPMSRRTFLAAGTGAILAASLARAAVAAGAPVVLSAAHREAMRRRKRRIVVQYDANDPMWTYWKLHRNREATYDRFQQAIFSYLDDPATQIDGLWWDIGGSPLGCSYPSRIEPPVDHPMIRMWLADGIDWVERLVNETRRRNCEAFWNHRISEVECLPEGGLSKDSHPLKLAHPDWVVKTSWWPQGMWNLAAPGLREHKVALLRELATRYDLDGIQIDFSRHIPCLPVGQQWELRGHVTEFMRQVRVMLLEVAGQRGRPFLLAAKIPQALAGCRVDGFDVAAWAEGNLVDILTLGSRTMDADVDGFRAVVGEAIHLQPCVDDHHATDGYRYPPIEFLRGTCANHFQRGANSVMTFNWSIGPPDVCRAMGSDIGPPSHQAAYREVGDPRTMAGKNKIFAVERRSGYPWADGFMNRNDTAPLPHRFAGGNREATFTLHVSDGPGSGPGKNGLTLRCILFDASEADAFEVRFNGTPLGTAQRDPNWKDPQIFSPKPQPNSGGKGQYVIDPAQRLLRLEWAVPVWRTGPNEVEVRIASGRGGQIEKIEGWLKAES